MEVLEYEYLPNFEGSIVLARGDSPMGLGEQAVGDEPSTCRESRSRTARSW